MQISHQILLMDLSIRFCISECNQEFLFPFIGFDRSRNTLNYCYCLKTSSSFSFFLLLLGWIEEISNLTYDLLWPMHSSSRSCYMQNRITHQTQALFCQWSLQTKNKSMNISSLANFSNTLWLELPKLDFHSYLASISCEIHSLILSIMFCLLSTITSIKVMSVTLVTYIPTWRTPKMVN